MLDTLFNDVMKFALIDPTNADTIESGEDAGYSVQELTHMNAMYYTSSIWNGFDEFAGGLTNFLSSDCVGYISMLETTVTNRMKNPPAVPEDHIFNPGAYSGIEFPSHEKIHPKFIRLHLSNFLLVRRVSRIPKIL